MEVLVLIITTLGVFSITASNRCVETITIRSRGRAELEALRERYCPSLQFVEPEHTDGFRFRASASKVHVAGAICGLLGDLDYAQLDRTVAGEQSVLRGAFRRTLGELLDACDTVQPVEPTTPRPVWTPGRAPCRGLPNYGGVVFSRDGKVLLRHCAAGAEPASWTFFHGKVRHCEVPRGTVRRLAQQALGVEARANEVIPGEFWCWDSRVVYYILEFLAEQGPFDCTITAEVRRCTADEAKQLLAATPDRMRRMHSLAVMNAAFEVILARGRADDPMDHLSRAIPARQRKHSVRRPK